MLYIYADGPKENANEEVISLISETREVVKSKKWCKEVHVIESNINKGLAESVILGITEVINKHEKVIVLEDDLIISPYFLKYMNDGLELYRGIDNVYSINGFMFPVKYNGKADTFLSPLATSTWGWATWKGKWKVLESVFENNFLKNDYLKSRFNFGEYNFLGMIENKNSWGIRWYYSVFIRNGLGVFPTHTLVKNIGMDGSGTHKEYTRQYSSSVIEDIREISTVKDKIDLNLNALMIDYLKSNSNQKVKKNKFIIKIKIFLKDVWLS